MKPSSFLIKTARGGLVDEAAPPRRWPPGGSLAWLDVSALEPLPATSLLRSLENVVPTLHRAGGSVPVAVAMTERSVDQILAIRAGRSPGDQDLLNPETLRALSARGGPVLVR